MNAPFLASQAQPATSAAPSVAVPSALTRHTHHRVEQLLERPDLEMMRRLELAQRELNRWRQQLLVNTLRARVGDRVQAGPFAGMHYTQATEGATLPRCLGCYEAELHPHLQALPAIGYDCVIDIGCAEGYYAVGLARLLPGCRVHAHDIDPRARRACAELAVLNGVRDRVQVQGEFRPADFAAFAGRRTLVFCDIEGEEAHLLDPRTAPALAAMDLIVEVHECFRPGLVDELSQRFAATHAIDWVWPDLQVPRELPDWVRRLSHMDQLLCTWEWRAGPTPWAVMRSRQAG